MIYNTCTSYPGGWQLESQFDWNDIEYQVLSGYDWRKSWSRDSSSPACTEQPVAGSYIIDGVVEVCFLRLYPVNNVHFHTGNYLHSTCRCGAPTLYRMTQILDRKARKIISPFPVTIKVHWHISMHHRHWANVRKPLAPRSMCSVWRHNSGTKTVASLNSFPTLYIEQKNCWFSLAYL